MRVATAIGTRARRAALHAEPEEHRVAIGHGASGRTLGAGHMLGAPQRARDRRLLFLVSVKRELEIAKREREWQDEAVRDAYQRSAPTALRREDPFAVGGPARGRHIDIG